MPLRGNYFQLKNLKKYLAINYFSYQRNYTYVRTTEIKAFTHWHFEFSMASFWAVPVFRNEVWTVWSAYATADYPARPGRPHRPNLPTQKPSWQWRNSSLLTFLAGRTKEQVLDKGNRQKIHKTSGLNRLQCLCPGSPKRDPLDSEKMQRLPKLEYEFLG